MANAGPNTNGSQVGGVEGGGQEWSGSGVGLLLGGSREAARHRHCGIPLLWWYQGPSFLMPTLFAAVFREHGTDAM